jgi:hypothetical protein
MPNVETHPMHGAHLQAILKMECLQLQIAFYNYGNGVSQEIIDYQWFIMIVVD